MRYYLLVSSRDNIRKCFYRKKISGNKKHNLEHAIC